MIESIVFDFDGVIVIGTNAGYYESNNKVIKELSDEWGKKLKTPYSKEAVDGLVKKCWGITGVKVLTDHILPHFFVGYNNGEETEAVNRFTKYLSNYYTKNCQLAPRLKEFVKEVLPSYKHAIVSATDDRIIRAVLKREGLNNDFKTIICGHKISDPNLHKPHPYMLQEAIRLINAQPETTIYIGDTEGDVKMARNAGVRPIIVTTGALTHDEALKLGLPETDVIAEIRNLIPLLNIPTCSNINLY